MTTTKTLLHIRRLYIFCIISLLHITVEAQTVWVDSCVNNSFVGTINFEDSWPFSNFWDVRVYPGDDIIATGRFSSYDNHEGSIGSPGVVMRISKTGELKWTKFIAYNQDGEKGFGQVSTFTIARNGDIIALCEVTTPDLSSGLQIILVRLTPDGEVVWKQRIPTYTAVNYYYYITETADNGFLLNAGQESAGMLLKLDQSGTVLWKRAYYLAPSTTRIHAVTESPTGYYFTGSTYLENPNYNVLVKVDKTDGHVLWSRSFDHAETPEFYYHWMEYDKGQLKLAGYTAPGHPNAGAQALLTFDENGQFLSGKKIELSANLQPISVNILRKRYFHIPTRTGVHWEDNPFTSDFYVSRFNEVTGKAWAYKLPYNGGEFLSGMDVMSDSSTVLAGSTQTDVGYTRVTMRAILMKTSPIGTLGNCPVTPVETNITNRIVTVRQTTIQAEEVQKGGNGPAIQSVYDGKGFSWDVSCRTESIVRLGRIKGPTQVCTGSKLTYTAPHESSSANPVQFHTSDPSVLIEAVNDDTFTVTFTKSGTIVLYATLQTDCGALKDSMIVTAQSSPGPVNLGGDQSLCPENTIVLNARKGYVSYLWQDGSTDSTLTASQPGTYHIAVVDVCSNLFRDTLTITAQSPPPFSLGQDKTKCNSDSVHLIAQTGFQNYQWAPDYRISSKVGGNVWVNPTVDTSYVVQSEYKPGCIVRDTVRIKVINSPRINLGSDTSICIGTTVSFDAGSGFQSYQWSNSSRDQRIHVATAGQYSVTGTTVEGCRSVDTVRITNIWNPVVRLDPNPSLCKGTTRLLDAGDFSSYTWQDGSTDRYFPVTTLGEYFVSVKDAYGCGASGTVRITTHLPTPSNFLPSDTAICSYNTLKLQPLESFSSYAWMNGSTRPDIVISAPGEYWLEVKDNNGCIGKDTVRIHQADCGSGMFVPTAFTPNGDGKNDVFRPVVLGRTTSFSFAVYNRWGQPVFTTTDPSKGWNGKVASVTQQTDVYVWMCQYQFEGDIPRTARGTVNLIR
ncbi:gliding motility-associated C-terminal domain-containing protein [Flavisolibacter sp. BT320]|nr:gliding motility-associated C-terminal domain-containing protein [Flavisolibacter longurius]